MYCGILFSKLYKTQQGANVTVQFRQHYLTLLNDLLLLSVEKSPVNDVVNILWRFVPSLFVNDAKHLTLSVPNLS